MQATWRVYLVSTLLACVVAAVVAAGTAFVTVRFFAPAPTAPLAAKTAIQEDTAEVHWGEELEVFYKTPFAAPPHLTFPEGLESNCHVADQKATSFKLRRDKGGQASKEFPRVKWKAAGQSTP